MKTAYIITKTIENKPYVWCAYGWMEAKHESARANGAKMFYSLSAAKKSAAMKYDGEIVEITENV